jgi:hypothetical protein
LWIFDTAFSTSARCSGCSAQRGKSNGCRSEARTYETLKSKPMWTVGRAAILLLGCRNPRIIDSSKDGPASGKQSLMRSMGDQAMGVGLRMCGGSSHCYPPSSLMWMGTDVYLAKMTWLPIDPLCMPHQGDRPS